MKVSQIALTSFDREALRDWYVSALGYLPTTTIDVDDYPQIDFAAMQGLPYGSFSIGYVLDRQEFFQIEFIEYRDAPAVRRPDDWRPCDLGYAAIGLHVADLDSTLSRLAGLGSRTLTPPMGVRGRRRVCVRDPEGTLLELMEDDPRAPEPNDRPRTDVPVATRSITLSVADLERSARFFVDTLGMKRAENAVLHRPEHEALWGMAGARRESVLLWSGDFMVELVRYADPVGRPRREGYLPSDQGFNHLALGTRSRPALYEALESCKRAGYHTRKPLEFGAVNSTVYVLDDQDFTVELFFIDTSIDVETGYAPAPVAGPAGDERIDWLTAASDDRHQSRRAR